MPMKKYNNKKKNGKRYYKKNALVNNRKLVRPKTYGFSRTREHLLALESPTDSWITTLDGSVVKTLAFSLSELNSYAEFTNLFDMYKLNMAIIKMYPSYSQVVSTTASVASTNYVITVWPNTSGTALTAAFDQNALNQIQRKSQWMFPLNKPTQIKCYLKQLNQVYATTAGLGTDYTVVKPKYISTAEPHTPHYGLNIHIRKVDGSSFGSDSARLLIKEKIYLTTRQVK